MFSRSHNMISGGIFSNQNRVSRGMFNNQNHRSRGLDLLMEWVATGAFHSSDELYDAAKCHPHTRVAVLDDIMRWINHESESVQDDFMLWLFGPAGAGKSTIAKRIAEIAAQKDLLIADFFFSRSSPTRNTIDHLVATLAYQLALSIPHTQSYIEDAVEQDPAIFKKNVQTQIDTLLIRPLQSTISSTQIIPSQKLIIIDGLDECNDVQAQITILEATSHSFTQRDLPLKFLVVSRPEMHLATLFNHNESLKYIHYRLALDNTYRPDDDIRLFFTDMFNRIRHTHPLRSTIPITWPSQDMLDILVKKSSGYFIYASTVVKFVESIRHQPTARLNIILGISPLGRTNPSELDDLYNHILSSVDDIQLTLRVLSLYVITPNFASHLRTYMSPHLFLSLEPGDIELALLDLSSVLTYHESSNAVEVLHHVAFADFLSNKHRSNTFYIDTASTYNVFVRRTLQIVKGPDGILAGHIDLFCEVIEWFPLIQPGNDLNFDLDAFMKASIRRLTLEGDKPRKSVVF